MDLWQTCPPVAQSLTVELRSLGSISPSKVFKMSYSPKRKNKFDKALNYNTHRPGIIIKGIFQFLTVDDRITDEAAQYNVMPQTPMTRLN